MEALWEFKYFLECFLIEREKNYSRKFQEENHQSTNQFYYTNFFPALFIGFFHCGKNVCVFVNAMCYWISAFL